MLRGTTTRTLYVVLAAVLICLQLCTPTEAFASAYRGEVASCAEAEHPHKMAPPLGARRRMRDEDLVPETPARALLACDPAATYPPVPLAATHPRTSSASANHSPARLQVFLC
ncbi:hypothetical protein [Streptomyces sp. NPDC001530]|uniref:hypothetical protein n=1 Tax=Streptomyces sp. NPDC001530 TaxID=3364582 RepID=UPI0036BAF6FC